MNPSREQLRQLRRDNLKYPERLIEIPRADWPLEVLAVQRSGSVVVAAFRSRKFLVIVWDQGGHTRLSVNRTEWDERTKRMREDISWDDLQRLKAEAGYGDSCAVEVYPPDAHIVNVANMRHLFIVECPPFMWTRQ